MRPLLIFLTFYPSLLLFAQANKTPADLFAGAYKKIEINGHIKNYVPGDGNRFIRFRTYAITGRSRDTTFFIDNKGIFKAILSQSFECDLALMFDESFVTFYGTPGEKINMEIDPVKLRSAADKSQAITLTGRSAPISKLMMQFQLTGEEFLLPEENWSDDSTLSDKIIAEARIKRMNKEIDSLQKWMKKKGVTNKIFANWARHRIMYEAGSEIAHFLYAGKRRKLNDQQLMDLVKDIPLDNAKALNSSAYYSFLRTISIDMQIIVNINPMYDSVRRSMGKNAMSVYLDKMDKYGKGFAKQLMYYHTLTSNPAEKTGPYTERFDSVIKSPYLQGLVIENKTKTPFKPYSIIQRLKDYPVDDNLKARLISIFENNKKNLFLDFWGTWCAPCMREMPLYSRLMDQFKETDLKFMFFAVDTPEEKALAVKEKYGIDAPFIVLTDNEARILNHVLDFSSYPSHFIIGADGFVKRRLTTGLVSGNDLSKVALEEIKNYSAPWY
jgi:thiol-disulfide isomerase/thioredoxin